MNFHTSKASESHQRAYCLAAFAFLLLSSISLVGCNGGQNGGAPTPAVNSTSPSPSPSTGGTHVRPFDLSAGDTPIIVTGGSVYLDFGREFTQCTAGSPTPPCPATAPTAPNTVYYANGTLIAFAYYDDRDVAGHDPMPTATPMNPGDKVTIYGKKTGTGDRPAIVITNTNPAGSVTIQFPEELNLSSDPSNDEVFHKRNAKSHRRFLRKFTVDGVLLSPGGSGGTEQKVKDKSTIEFYTPDIHP